MPTNAPDQPSAAGPSPASSTSATTQNLPSASGNANPSASSGDGANAPAAAPAQAALAGVAAAPPRVVNRLAVVKPQYANGGGNGGGKVPPPPPPTITCAISSPAAGAAVVGANAGVSLTAQCTVQVSGLASDLWTTSMRVFVQFGSASYALATLRAGSPLVNGSTTWTYTGPTPTGGNLQINAYVDLDYGYPGGGGIVTKDAGSITVVPSSVSISVQSPYDGEVFVGTANGWLLNASGTASAANPAVITSVTWTLFNMANLQINSGSFNGPFGSATCAWQGYIQVPLGQYIVQFTATAEVNNQNPVTMPASFRIQVALQADVLDISEPSYLQALVDFATKPFTPDGHARVQTPAGAVTQTILDSTFYRSLGALLDDRYAAKSNEAVYQARICVEVLRQYIAKNPPTSAQAQALASAQSAYQLAAYKSILQQIGTSYDEIRLARTYDRQTSQGLANAESLAGRLGIDVGSLTDPILGNIGDHLDRLCLTPSGAPDTILTFELTVSDTAGATDSAAVSIIAAGNAPAITVSAGNNETVNKGATVTLTASATSLTPGASIAGYQWTQLAGPAVAITNPGTASASFVAPNVAADTVFTFQVMATDSNGEQARSALNVKVSAAARTLLASAGISQFVQQGAPVNLTGNATDTTAGAAVTYSWTQISGPAVTLVNPNTATAGFPAPALAHPVLPLSEQNLELLFGLVDSRRDPFSQGATIGDNEGLMTRWNVRGAEWNRTTDSDGIMYLSVSFVESGSPSQLMLFKDRGRTVLLATGEGNLPGQITLNPSGGSGVTASITIGKLGEFSEYEIGLSVFPRLLSWQYQHLRGVWKQQDFLFTQGAILGDTNDQITLCRLTGVTPGRNTDAGGILYLSLTRTAAPSYQVRLYQDSARTSLVASGAINAASGQINLAAANNSGVAGTITIAYTADSNSISIPIAFSQAPLIDPDLLIPADFNYPVATDPAYALYLARQTATQGWLNQLSTQAAGSLSGLNSILQSTLKDPDFYPNGMQIPDLLALNAKSATGEDISPQLTALSLPLDGFEDLVQLCPIVQSGFPILDSEWSDIYSILAQVLKVKSYSAWAIAENNAGLMLGPDEFVSPPNLPALPNTGVDPTSFSLAFGAVDPRWTIFSTPAWAASAPAYVTNNTYPLGAAWIPDDSTSLWISPHADESGNTNNGNPNPGEPPGLYTYRTTIDLAGYDPASVVLDLAVSVDDELRAVRVNGIGTGLTATGYSGVTSLTLNGPFKPGANTIDFVVFNAGSQPNPSGLRVAFSFDMPPVISALPVWRASAEARLQWQNRLGARVDQDSSIAEGLQSAVDQTEQQTLRQLRDALVAACALTSSIATLYSTGTNPARINLNGISFVDLSWNITAVPRGNLPNYTFIPQPPNSAWLANDPNSAWIAPSNNEASGPGDPVGNFTYHTTFDLSLFDPATVRIQMSVAADNGVNAVNLNGQPLGFSAEGFNAFTQFTISSGFIQGINTLDVVVNNSGAAANPSGLRVAFVSTAPVPVSADWVSQILLIDAASVSRQKISRLAEVTTMMQGLMFALRNGEFQQLAPAAPVSSWALNEGTGSFDEEWYWMGSYTNWQAVMRVFLYPENLLLPTMRVPASGTNGQPLQIAEFTQAFNDFVAGLDTITPLTSSQCLNWAKQYIIELVQNATHGGYNAVLPADLTSPNFAYPDPSAINLNQPPWGPAAADWSSPEAIPFLWEVWYFVPIHIALELQKAGQFESALDWFRLLYRYDLPLVNGGDSSRRVFYGLEIESAGLSQFEYAQIPTWMIDSANPHQIAALRLNPYTRFTLLSIVSALLDFADAQFGSETEESIAAADLLYLQAQTLLGQIGEALPSDPVTDGNPVFSAMQQRAESRLFNLNSGRNIAGMLLPDSAPTNIAVSIQPSQYRYSALIDRAKQLVTLAQQVEATYLASMEKADNETYTELKATQDLETANATVTLQQLQLQTATDGVTLAQDQVAKANNAVDHYNSLIGSDIVSQEQAAIDFQWAAAGLQAAAAAASAASMADPAADFFSGAANLASSLNSLAGVANTTSSILNAQASLEEKQSDWQFGLSQAQDDVAIGQQQVTIATDQRAAAAQQLTISQLQSDHAQATLNFLANKFTNAELYRWMSGVLGGVYAYFLQQAAAMARLAESQLAFERQKPALSVIRPSYWQPVTGSAPNGQNTQGLTGAETLLEDITTLDQYAFATDQIRLQITKQISLSLSDPYAFQNFTQTGELRFSTPMALFDQNFPGHYLRLISQVRVGVVALVPPGLGICATLANSGISRVSVMGNSGSFQSVIVQRDPQMIALSSSSSSNGLFAMTATAQSNLLQPFEDLGVDTTWEFVMPQAANPFDFNTIADVQISIDYTALSSSEYSQEVISQLAQSQTADRAYSFRQQFPDAWYALNNSMQFTTPFSVQFQSLLADFPPNLLNLSIAQLLLYLIPAQEASFQMQPTLSFTAAGTNTSAGGAAGAASDPNAPASYVYSTRRGNASNWIPILGSGVAGNWTFALPNTAATAAVFSNQQIQDILFVITYSANLPTWPQ